MTETDPLDILRRVDPAFDQPTPNSVPKFHGRPAAPSRRTVGGRRLLAAAAAVAALAMTGAVVVGGSVTAVAARPAPLSLHSSGPAAGQLTSLAQKLAAEPDAERSGEVVYTRTIAWSDQTTVSTDGTESEVVSEDRESWLTPSAVYAGRRGPGPLVEDDQVFQVATDYPNSVQGEPVVSPADPELYEFEVSSDPNSARMTHLSSTSGSPPAYAALDALGEILKVTPLSTANRARLVAALATVEGLESAGLVTDRAGRSAIALVANSDHAGALTQIVVMLDPEDGTLLGVDSTLLEPSEGIDRSLPTVLSYSVVLEQTFVETIGQR